MKRSKQATSGKKTGNGQKEISVARIGLISAVIVAVIGLIGGAVNTYLSNQAARDILLIPIYLTQTAEANILTQVNGNHAPTASAFPTVSSSQSPFAPSNPATTLPSTTMPETELNKVYLAECAYLSIEPTGDPIGEIYVPGTEFEYVTKDENDWFLVRHGSGIEGWLDPAVVLTQDIRGFFKINESGVVGYLVRMYSDCSGGDVTYIDLLNTPLGEVKIQINQIKTIQIRPVEGQHEASFEVETSNGERYIGTSPFTYLISKSTIIELNWAKSNITLTVIQNGSQ